MKKIITIILLLSLTLSLAGCGDGSFEYAELSVTVPKGYEKLKSDEANEKYDLALSDGRAVIGINRISRVDAAQADISDVLSAYELAELFMENAGDDSEIEMRDHAAYYIFYYTTQSGVRQFCVAAFFTTSPYAYYTMYCIAEASAEELYIKDFMNIIDGVRFKIYKE